MISAMIIVYNNARMIRQCVEHIVDVVDVVSIAEGGVTAQCFCHTKIDNLETTARSTDGTNDILDELQAKYPDRVIVSRKKDRWGCKEEMCNASIKKVEPGILWQIDSDEFWFRQHMRIINDWMAENPSYTAIEFWARHFFGGFTQHTEMIEGKPNTNEGWGNNPPWRRVFRHDGKKWASHEPPRLNHDGDEKVLTREESMREFKAVLFHYGYVWREQVVEKMRFHWHDPKNQLNLLKAFDAIQRGEEQDHIRLVNYRWAHPLNVLDFD